MKSDKEIKALLKNTPILDDVIKMISFVAMACLMAWAIYNDMSLSALQDKTKLFDKSKLIRP